MVEDGKQTSEVSTTELYSMPGFFSFLPPKVRYDNELPFSARVIYAEIAALTRATGYCYAHNDRLGERFNLSASNVGRLLSQLEKRGYIIREIERDEETNAVVRRKIWLNFAAVGMQTPPRKNAEGSPQKCGDPPRKIAGYIEVKNRINNNIPPISPKGERGSRKKKPVVTEPEAWAVLNTWLRDKPPWISERMHEFVDSCRDNRPDGKHKPLSVPAAKRLVNKLDKLSGGCNESIADLLDNSILHSWQDVYARENQQAPPDPPDTPDHPDAPDSFLLPGERLEDYLW